jgi:futalosine hydrolase
VNAPILAGALIVTAVEAEADAVRSGLPASPGPAAPVTVAAVGVGSAAAAAGTARLLALAEATGRPYRLVISAGIGGGFPGRAPVGATALASGGVAADLGAETPQGFLTLDQLGFGSATYDVDGELLTRLGAALPEAIIGTVVTVNTVTGTAESAERIAAHHPQAVVEAMEGYGVACAAATAGVAFAELRTVSNPVGPRDREAWRIGDALAALTRATTAIFG